MKIFNLRTILLCALCFEDFFRFSDVINLEVSDVVLEKKHIYLFLLKKTKITFSQKAIGYIY